MNNQNLSNTTELCGRHAAKQGGFNMIELMVGIAIVSVVLLFGLPSFSAWLQSNQIRNAAESVLGGLQLARNEAVRRNASVQFELTNGGGGVGLSDWRVICVTASATCPGVGQLAPNDQIQSRSSAEGSRNVRVLTANPIIVFNALGRMSTPAANTTIIFDNPQGGTCVAAGGNMRCLNVNVTTAGLIRMCDPVFVNPNPALPNPNSRGC
jgi:type IV fimbrial biogenesis protein FimT